LESVLALEKLERSRSFHQRQSHLRVKKFQKILEDNSSADPRRIDGWFYLDGSCL